MVKSMARTFEANKARLRRHQRIRRHLAGTSLRPRLNVFRSGQHIYAQLIDDTTGQTLVSASTLEAAMRDAKPEPVAYAPVEKKDADVEAATEAAPAKGKEAKAAKPAAKAPAKGGQAGKGAPGRPGQQVKTVLPQAQKGERKTPQEALAPIANNHRVALAREVGKLVAQRAQEKGVKQVVFDRGGYAFHGRVAALAEGAREGGLDF